MDRLDEVLELLKEALLDQGMPAVVLAQAPGEKADYSAPVLALRLKSCSYSPGAFLDYLGLRLDSESQAWRELYGKRLDLCLGLDIYAPREQGGSACGGLFGQLCSALGALPAGLKAKDLRCGAVKFDEGLGMFCCPAELDCSAYLCAEKDEESLFQDFRLRGVIDHGSQP